MDDLRCNGQNPWESLLPAPLPPPPTIEDVYNTFKGELASGPLGPVINYQGGDDPSGACPQFTIPASRYWNDITVTAHCAVYDQAAPIIYTVMTWAWAFVGLYLILF
jgi:hypothetical protein